MSAPLPTKVYLVDRLNGNEWSRARRLYRSWAQVKLFMSPRIVGRGREPLGTFRVYEADVVWQEVEV